MMLEVGRLSVVRAAFLLFASCLITIPVQAQYGGGTGEPNAPYFIRTAEQMNAIGANPMDWGKHFRLVADIWWIDEGRDYPRLTRKP